MSQISPTLGDIIQAKYDDYLKYAKSINPNLDYEQDVLHEVIADNPSIPQYVNNPDAYIKRCIRNKYIKVLEKEIAGTRINPRVEIDTALFLAAVSQELLIGFQYITEGKADRSEPEQIPTTLNYSDTALKPAALDRFTSNPWPAIDAAIDIHKLLRTLNKKDRNCVSACHLGSEEVSDVAMRYGIKIKSGQKVSQRAVVKLQSFVVIFE